MNSNKKFIKSYPVNNYEVLTDTGYENIEFLHKTIKYEVYELKIKNGNKKSLVLECADNHIVFDSAYNEIFVKKLKPGNIILIDNVDNTGTIETEVISVNNTKRIEHMYDLELPEKSNHRYYTNNILSHNSSLAKVLVQQFGHPFKYINASRESSVDVIRDQISNFCALQSLDTIKHSKGKIVILDEIDGASAQFHKALRASMDEFSHVGFIATCNYINKIPEPIKSRFNVIDFTFNEEDRKPLKYKYAKRLVDICQNEGLQIGKDGLEAIIPKHFPDMRAMLNLIQGLKSEGITVIDSNSVKASIAAFNKVFELVFTSKGPDEIYSIIMKEYSGQIENIMSSFANDFLKYIQLEKVDYLPLFPNFIVKIANYQSKLNQVIDPILAVIAMVYDMRLLVEQFKKNKKSKK